MRVIYIVYIYNVDYQHKSSVSNPTIQRFFALHYLLPFVLAALVILHLIALHVHGSSNPIGITGNLDRLSFHPYFVFKDLITIYVFLILFCFFVFFSPNTLGQEWPLLILLYSNNICIKLISQCTICWKYLKLNYNKTIYIRGLFIKLLINYANPIKVKYYYNKYNQQITKVLLILVGISETIRAQKLLFKIINYSNKENKELIINKEKVIINKNIKTKNMEKFNEWLGGLIDGDGYFYVSKEGKVGLEITVGIEDERMLKEIQNAYGGSIKLRSGSKSLRYRLGTKEYVKNLVNGINGNIRNTKRLVQFSKLCSILEIEVLAPKKLNLDNNWLAGFFDGDGIIDYYLNNNKPELFISVSNRYLVDIEDFKELLGGNIYFDKSQNGNFRWNITDEVNHMKWYEYIKNNPSRSLKGRRIFMLKRFYSLYNEKAYLDNNTFLYKSWCIFDKKWKSYKYKIS